MFPNHFTFKQRTTYRLNFLLSSSFDGRRINPFSSQSSLKILYLVYSLTQRISFINIVILKYYTDSFLIGNLIRIINTKREKDYQK